MERSRRVELFIAQGQGISKVGRSGDELNQREGKFGDGSAFPWAPAMCLKGDGVARVQKASRSEGVAAGALCAAHGGSAIAREDRFPRRRVARAK